MSLSATIARRAELNPEPIFETIGDLVTDIREAAEELYQDPTHLDLVVEAGYAPRLTEAWTRHDDYAYGRLFPAAPVWSDAVDALDAAQWIGDTFAALLDREPGEEFMVEMGPGVWRLALNPPFGI